jgi:hypothetical protein
MRRPPSARVPLPADQGRAGQVRKRGDLAVAQREIDMLALARAGSGQQGRHDGIRRIKPRREVRHGHADFNRRSVSRPGNVHQAHFRLDHDIVARSLPARSRLPVACYARVYQGGVDGVEGLEVQLVLL